MAFSPETYGLLKGLNGQPGGFASLNSNGKVPSNQLPSYVDEIEEYSSRSAFPVSGETGIIYLALDTGSTYRWGETTYVEISAKDIFYCTYNSTTSAEISAALSADKIPVIIEDDKLYIYSNQPDSTTEHWFSCCYATSAGTINIDMIRCYLESSTTKWSKTTVNPLISSNLTSYATLASPTFTGVPTAPTATDGTNTTQIATTAFVQNAIVGAIGGSY